MVALLDRNPENVVARLIGAFPKGWIRRTGMKTKMPITDYRFCDMFVSEELYRRRAIDCALQYRTVGKPVGGMVTHDEVYDTTFGDDVVAGGIYQEPSLFISFAGDQGRVDAQNLKDPSVAQIELLPEDSLIGRCKDARIPAGEDVISVDRAVEHRSSFCFPQCFDEQFFALSFIRIDQLSAQAAHHNAFGHSLIDVVVPGNKNNSVMWNADAIAQFIQPFASKIVLLFLPRECDIARNENTVRRLAELLKLRINIFDHSPACPIMRILSAAELELSEVDVRKVEK